MSRPRIRTVKPELWQDEKVGSLSRDARILFVGLITMADDEGRLRALPAAILGHVFPYDDDAPRKLNGWLQEIADSGLVVAYVTGITPYIQLIGWGKHQRINRPSPSDLPPAPVTELSVKDHGPAAEESSPHAQRRAPADRKGREGNPFTPETEQGKVVTFDRKPVPAARLQIAERILGEFNRQAGTGYGAYTGRGRPSEDLKRILSALADADPPLDEDEAARIIRWRLAEPFWTGRPHTGVVFGPNVFPANRESASTNGGARRSVSSTDLGAALRAAAEPTRDDAA